MLGTAIHHWHLTPDTFWKMTSKEYWAAMRTANPELEKQEAKSNNFWSEEELEEIERIKGL